MTSPVDYAETVGPPPSWWAIGVVFVGTVFWLFVVATSVLAPAIAAGVAAIVAGWLLRGYAARISTDEVGLHAGPAVLPWPYIGTVEVLDADRTRRQLGVDADATAYLVVRPYCPTSVKVTVDDERDPTPYWMVSTRRPDELALSLRPRSRQG